uniref:EF-hand domain-containing protein n=1 Tax=Parascaris univalens TaxID=6257 RepID=A0A914ZJ02_PARUN
FSCDNFKFESVDIMIIGFIECKLHDTGISQTSLCSYSHRTRMTSSIATFLACSSMLIYVKVVHLHEQSTSADETRHKFAANEAIHDKKHLKQHLENKINVNEEWDIEKESFYYFSMNDLNHDQRIDGLEILKAIVHTHPQDPNPSAQISENTLEEMVDAVLKDIDINNDGVIDFAEYTLKQNASTSSPSSPI